MSTDAITPEDAHWKRPHPREWLPTTRFVISKHALDQYRERVDKDGTEEDVVCMAQQSFPAGTKLQQTIVRNANAIGKGVWISQPGTIFAFHSKRNVVLVLATRPTPGSFVVKTCWRLSFVPLNCIAPDNLPDDIRRRLYPEQGTEPAQEPASSGSTTEEIPESAQVVTHVRPVESELEDPPCTEAG